MDESMSNRAFPRRRWALRLGLAWGVVALALAPALRAQQPSEPPAEAGGAEAQPGEESATGGEDTGTSELGDIDQILAGEAEALGGGGYTYDPGDCRDPFKSLLASRDRPDVRGPRPEGIPGLLIDELRVTGVFHTRRGWVAQAQAGAKQKSFLLKEGDQLYDGDVVSITKTEVVFKQIVQDPTALKPFREVVKKLNP